MRILRIIWNLECIQAPVKVRKAIKRSGGYKNYWNIRPYLPRETAGYVPAFYATMYIFEYAEEHKIYSEIPMFFNFRLLFAYIFGFETVCSNGFDM